jgi:hypothetical protein
MLSFTSYAVTVAVAGSFAPAPFANVMTSATEGAQPR